MKKVLKRVLFVFLGVLGVSLISFVIIYFNVIRTFFSVKQISNAPAYYVHVYGDFWFDDYLKNGVKNSSELESFISGKLTLGLYKPDTSKNHGCSSFFAKTPDGDYILAQDLDLCIENPHMPIVAEYQKNKKIYAIGDMNFLTTECPKMTAFNKILTNAVPYITENGMNQDGLAVAVATAAESDYKNQSSKTTLIDCTLQTAVLSNASNVEEAIQYLKKYNVTPSSTALLHLMIADAKGNCAVVEWAKGSMQVLRCDGNYQIMANFILYQNSQHTGFGSDRYQAYEESLGNCKGVLTEKEAMNLLEKNTIKNDEDWSVVYNLTKKKISVCFYGDYEHTYTYSFS
ncbi:MAG TPA: linear amide C-N hydrolase [Oscillospiraceae bacterium]|nr:linear amide C-N hydrolase [Oscillospiraceae bacterium]